MIGSTASRGEAKTRKFFEPLGPGLGFRAAGRLCLVPFLVAKALTFLVITLTLWQQNSTTFPSLAQLKAGLAYWDGQQYLQIASQGYPSNVNLTPGAAGHLWAYLPGFPLLIHGVSLVFQDLTWSGVLVAGVGEFLALVFLARLISAERNQGAARLAVWLLAFAPFGVFLTVVYTESAFLAAALACLYYGRQGRFGLAVLAGAIATALRVTGLVLLPVIALEFILRRGKRLGFEGLLIPLIGLPFLLFCIYAQIHAGDFWAYFHIEASASFNRVLTLPWVGFLKTLSQTGNILFAEQLGLGVLGFFACAALWAWPWLGPRLIRGKGATPIPWSFALYATLVWLLIVAQPYWLSVGRYELGLVPVFIMVVDIARRRPQWAFAALAGSAGLCLFITTLWTQGVFVA